MSEELQVYLNGRIVPQSQATVSVADAAFLYGGSVFTTLSARHGRPFRLDRHLRRLLDTAALLDMRIDEQADEETLTASVMTVLQANGLAGPEAAARLRITLSPGEANANKPTTLITCQPLPAYPAEMYEKGISVVVSSFKQHHADPIYGHKTGCYFMRLLARQEAHRKGAQEALWYTLDNHLAEGCFTNVFLVAGGKVLTPPRDTPVLPGITRSAVLELCHQLHIPASDDQPLNVNDMLSAEEIFLTSSVMGVVPVARVERHPVGQEKAGPITRQILQAYNELVERETG